jgi:hypothetical protein
LAPTAISPTTPIDLVDLGDDALQRLAGLGDQRDALATCAVEVEISP